MPQTSIDVIATERENFRNLFRQTPEMVCILRGPNHVFDFVNEAHIRALGFDATGMAVREAQPESVEVHGILDDVYRSGKTAELREIPVTLSDRIRYFNLTYSARRDPLGNVDGVMVLGEEVTEQYLNREVFKIQNKALEMTLGDAPIGAVLQTLAAGIDRQLGGGVQAKIHPVALPPAENFGASTTPLLSSQGKRLGTLVVAGRTSPLAPNEQEVINLMAHTAALIIERHQQKQEKLAADVALVQSDRLLRQSEEQLGMALQVAKVGFYDWDIIADQVVFSKQMLADWGMEDTGVGRLEDAIARIHPDDRQRVAELIEATLRDNTLYAIEYRVVRADGKVVWMDVRGQVHRDPHGVPLRFFGTSYDITEQKEKEAMLQNAQLAAESASAAKGMFLANMSHEIRTPLGAIMGFVDLLKNPELTAQEHEDYIRVIDRNSQHLMRIVDDVLDLSKIEAGKIVIEPEDFCLVDLLTDFASLMALKAREKALLFHLDIDSPLPSKVRGDPTRLRQVLSNIVGNSFKFTRAGEIRLRVRMEQFELHLSVEDTGTGISAETAARLFEPFSQADSSTTRVFGGTGLGLALTRRLTQAMGGACYLAQSEPGRGSTFVATVQLEPAQCAPLFVPAKSPASVKGGPLAGLRVLVADDAPDNRILIRKLLTFWGADCETAEDGRQAVAAYKRCALDAILMDIQMPLMDGHEATRHIRSEGSRLPIIALTAHAMKEEQTRCRESGFTDFLSKPINRESLLATLQKCRAL